jgi:membrane-bound lytic murein transglycosylase A
MQTMHRPGRRPRDRSHSLALNPIDRAIWSSGLPFWISGNLPWRGPSPSLAQDTGSAITGPARCDIFFGSGDDAGARAGDIRHAGEIIVLLPVEEVPGP